MNAYYQLVLLYLLDVADILAAEVLFAQMETSYPDDELTEMARIELNYFVENTAVTFSSPSMSDHQTGTAGTSAYLEQNYPNPFNPTTTISYSVETHGHASLRVYNTAGQLVKTLVNGLQSPGQHSVVWDGTNENDQSVVSGLYFYQLEAGDKFSDRKRMLLLK